MIKQTLTSNDWYPRYSRLATHCACTNKKRQFCNCKLQRPGSPIFPADSMAPSLKGCGFGSSLSSDGDPRLTFRSLLESERGSDLVLLVGGEGGRERIPAHSWVLCHGSDYFRTRLTGAFRDPHCAVLYFPDDQPQAFNHLIRWLYGWSCSPDGTQSALDALQVAMKYLCPDLVHHLVCHLSSRLRPTSVLQVLAWGDHYANCCAGPQPSAPPLCDIDGTAIPVEPLKFHCDEEECLPAYNCLGHCPAGETKIPRGPVSLPIACPSPRRHSESSTSSISSSLYCCSVSKLSSSPVTSSSLPSSVQNNSSSLQSCCHCTCDSSTTSTTTDPTRCCRVLVGHCFSYIDTRAGEVLSSEKLESLPANVLTAVLCRSSLGVPNETLVLDALYRWSTAECRRQHQPLTLAGRRTVLGANMLTLPRLLTLKQAQLSSMNELYETQEIVYVRARVKMESSMPALPPLFRGSVEDMAQPRVAKPGKGSNSAVLCRRFSKNMMNMVSVIALVID